MTPARIYIKEACYQMRAFLAREKAEVQRYRRRRWVAEDGIRHTVLIAYTKDRREAVIVLDRLKTA